MNGPSTFAEALLVIEVLETDLRGAVLETGKWRERWEEQTAEKNALLAALGRFTELAHAAGERFHLTMARDERDRLVSITLANDEHHVHAVLWEKAK